MKLLILTSRFPYPIEKGDKLRIYHQIRHLAKQHTISLVSISDQAVEEEALEHLREFCAEIHIFPISKPGIYLSLAKAIFSSNPFQVQYFYRKKFHRHIQQIAENFKPQRVYCQLIRMAPYVGGLEAAKTLDYMDCFSVGMERRTEMAKGLYKMLFKSEARRLKAYEEAVFSKFNSHGIISEQDKTLLPGPYAKKVEVIPNGVDTEYFEKDKMADPEFDLVFVGNMGYAPNIVAARYLALRVLPEIRKEKPKARLLLAGARPEKGVQELEKEPGVKVGGWYEDIREAYGAGKVFVAPLFTGSGQQNKILEAMAMEIPCVSTELVNNAIHGEEGKEILVAKDLDAFVKHCLYLLDEPESAANLGKNGRNFVKENYSWEKSMEILEKVLTQSVSITL